MKTSKTSKLKTGILMMLVGIAIIGMTASSVSAYSTCLITSSEGLHIKEDRFSGTASCYVLTDPPAFNNVEANAYAQYIMPPFLSDVSYDFEPQSTYAKAWATSGLWTAKTSAYVAPYP